MLISSLFAPNWIVYADRYPETEMRDDTHQIEFRRLTAEWTGPLLVFLSDLKDKDLEYFRPHPFTNEAVEKIISNTHRDLYYVLAEGEHVLAYGMLRGWDEGYEVPSLGIAVHPQARGKGLGKALMHFLGAAAKWNGATRVRLKVNRGNARAARLYKSLGYEFGCEEEEYLVGVLELGDAPI